MRSLLTTTALVTLCGTCSAQVTFTPQPLPNGGVYKTDFGMLSGVAAADYDADGDIDIFIPAGDGELCRLLQNNDGAFTDIAASVGLTQNGRARSALFFDYNADGRLDLVVARDCHSLSCPQLQTITFFEQTPEGQFVDVTPGSGLEGNKSLNAGTHSSGFAAADIDNDGWLDLVYASWNGQIYVYHNNQGDGTFADISVSSGISLGLSFYWQPVFADFTGDGNIDLFIGMDFLPDQLWVNQGDGTFVNIAGDADCDVAWNGMGVSLGDIENDGDWDVYVTNISVESTGKYSTLYVNETAGPTPAFVESSIPLKTDASGWGWGNTFLDYDLDADVDLAVTNGRTGGAWAQDPSCFYENTLDAVGTFTKVSDEVGFNDTFVGSTVIAADLDRDGDLDLIQTCTNTGGGSGQGIFRVLFSDAAQQPDSGNWLSVRLRMTGPNTHAIGAVVKAVTGDTTQMRLLTAGISMIGQEPAEAHFGLGEAETVDQVIIKWPNGITSVLKNIDADQLIDVVAPLCGADIDASGSVDSTDLNTVLAAFGTSSVAGDIDGDGMVGSTDLNAVLASFGGCN